MPEGESFFDKRDRPGGDDGGPPERKKGVGILGDKVGGVPGWGWLLGGLAVGYYFLVWRPQKMAAANAAASTKDQQSLSPLGYTPGGVGGVFLLPGGGVGSSAPAPIVPPPGKKLSVSDVLVMLQNRIFQQAGELSGGNSLADFFKINTAAQTLGLPYFQGDNTVHNPATGASYPVNWDVNNPGANQQSSLAHVRDLTPGQLAVIGLTPQQIVDFQGAPVAA